jgi:hypothetical protein
MLIKIFSIFKQLVISVRSVQKLYNEEQLRLGMQLLRAESSRVGLNLQLSSAAESQLVQLGSNCETVVSQ